MTGKRKYATIKDVAELAGTSVATVSYVLNKKPNKSISQETIDRVMQAVADCNYSKSAIASGLKGKKQRIVYIIIPQFNNIYYTRVCQAVEAVLFENDIIPIICDSNETPSIEKSYIDNAISMRAEGVILGPTVKGWENSTDLRNLGIPLVTIGREFMTNEDTSQTYYVGDDSFQAGFTAGRMFASRGHAVIGMVDWEGEAMSALERRAGFIKAVSEVSPATEVVRETSSILDVQTGYQLTKKLFEKRKPTALFFSYHKLAQGGIEYLHDMNIKVPSDVQVSMIGTPTWANLFDATYTTINQHEGWVGTTAGKIMLGLLRNDESETLLKEHRHVCRCDTSVHNPE